MKFILFTNSYNPHMITLGDELFRVLGDEFMYIYTDRINNERIKLGWTEKRSNYKYYFFDNIESYQDEIDNADVVYFGADPRLFKYIKNRIYSGKLTFFHEERILKHGILQFFIPKYTKYYIEQRIKPTYLENVYTLACSAYLKEDLKRLHANTDRVLKFGYFAAFREINISEKKINKKVRILCASRLINLKHVDNIIKAIKIVHRHNEKIELNIVGAGPEEKKIKKLILKNNMNNYVSLVGPLPPDKVREEMEKSDIFIAASDKREGWGVVINEAMNSGCVVIASKQMGSVPYLIKDRFNGLTYNYNDINKLAELLMETINNKKLREMLSLNAYNSINGKWNANAAAKRLIKLIDQINNKKAIIYEEGICSKA